MASDLRHHHHPFALPLQAFRRLTPPEIASRPSADAADAYFPFSPPEVPLCIHLHGLLTRRPALRPRPRVHRPRFLRQ